MLLACRAGDGNRTRAFSLGRVLIPPRSRVLQRFWRPHLAPVDLSRPGRVARVWPGSLSIGVEAGRPLMGGRGDPRPCSRVLLERPALRPSASRIGHRGRQPLEGYSVVDIAARSLRHSSQSVLHVRTASCTPLAPRTSVVVRGTLIARPLWPRRRTGPHDGGWR